MTEPKEANLSQLKTERQEAVAAASAAATGGVEVEGNEKAKLNHQMMKTGALVGAAVAKSGGCDIL